MAQRLDHELFGRDCDLLGDKLDVVKRLPIRVLGTVLNDIRAEGAYRYYSYIYGYSLDEDEGMQELAAPVDRN